MHASNQTSIGRPPLSANALRVFEARYLRRDQQRRVIETQGGKRRGANMGVLRVDHPDILEFVRPKLDQCVLQNVNLSVAVTDSFMRALQRDEQIPLKHPHRRGGGHAARTANFRCRRRCRLAVRGSRIALSRRHQPGQPNPASRRDRSDKERGVFPNWAGSVYEPQGLRVRNATRTAIAPTGTIGIIAGTTPSIEPLFALAYRRKHVLDEEGKGFQGQQSGKELFANECWPGGFTRLYAPVA